MTSDRLPAVASRLDRVSQEDRAWFERDPARRCRVRPFVPCELPGSPRGGPPRPRLHDHARGDKPDARLRLVAILRRPPLNAEAEGERLWREAAARFRLPTGGTVDDVVAAIEAEAVRDELVHRLAADLDEDGDGAAVVAAD